MEHKIKAAMQLFTDGRYYRFRLFLEGIAIGIFAGLVVAAFRYALELTEIWRPRLMAYLAAECPAGFAAWFALLFGLAFVLAKIVELEPLSTGSGIPQIKGILIGRMHMCWLRVLVLKFIGAVLGIGVGLSLGREGPSVQLGACVGQGLSRLRHRPASEERFLLTAGSGAGLAAAFNAPLAGVIFCLEEIYKNVSPHVLTAAIGATVTATAVTGVVFSLDPVFHVGVLELIPLGPMYLLLIGLGLFVGCLGRIFNPLLLASMDWYGSLPLRGWQKLLLPLLSAGVLTFLLPDVLGGGSFLVDRLVAQTDYALLALVLLFAVKLGFTLLCFGSGTPGGIFLPMLVLGAVSGAIYAKLLLICGLLTPEWVPQFVVFGMAAYFAVVVKSPVTGSVLIMEMTGAFGHMLALIIVAMSAYLVSDLSRGEPVYEELLARSLRLQKKISSLVSSSRVLLELMVGEGSSLAYKYVKEVIWPGHAFLLNVRRGSEELTPAAEMKLLPGDCLYVLVDEPQLEEMNRLAEEKSRLQK